MCSNFYPAEGLVVGVLGPWGSGKTSFVNIPRQSFARAEISVVDFNPWMFSGAEQLVSAFFTELFRSDKQPKIFHISQHDLRNTSGQLGSRP